MIELSEWLLLILIFAPMVLALFVGYMWGQDRGSLKWFMDKEKKK